MRSLVAISVILASLWLLVSGEGQQARARLLQARDRRAEQYAKLTQRASYDEPASAPEKRAASASPFLNSKSAKFAVNGTGLPDIPFDVGESYAGLLPISNKTNETRELFFWFFPSTNPEAKDEITIWLQGGPGVSSLFGLLVENGPFVWQPGTGTQPVPNTYSWTNLTNVVWIDQPVGTGFSTGTPNISNDYELAKEFMGFWKNFVNTFNMKGYKIYITGESYGGYYVPYIANGFIEANDTQYYNLEGISVNDPIIGDIVVQFEGVAVQYLNYWSNVFGLNETTMAAIEKVNQACGYAAYLEKYFQFPPPKGPFPGLFGAQDQHFTEACDVQTMIVNAATELNPCFNADHIYDTCPALYSPVGPYNVPYQPPGSPVYFDRLDVQKAIHAPLIGSNWSLATPENVYVGPNAPFEASTGDDSQPPAKIDILSKIIEKTNNVIVGVGGLDFQLPANGTLFVFQNMTWNGVQGFSTYPSNSLYVPQHNDNPGTMSGFGQMGTWVEERGFTFYISSFSGHEDPWYTPGVAYRVLGKLLGRLPNLSAVEALL